MRLQSAIVALGLATATLLPLTSAAAKPNAFAEERVEARVTYSPDAPAAETYRHARRVLRKACYLNGQSMAMQRVQERVCVQPMLDKFVAHTGNPELAELHEARTGRLVRPVRIATR